MRPRQHYHFEFEQKHSVAKICRFFRKLPSEVADVQVDVDKLFQGRTSIECVQIQMAFFATNLTRTMNHDSDFVVSTSTHKDVGNQVYLDQLTAKQRALGSHTNRQVKAHVNHLYRRGGVSVEGVCFALAYLSGRAYVLGQLPVFIDRTHAFTCIGSYQLEAFLLSLKKMIVRLGAEIRAYMEGGRVVDIRLSILQHRLEAFRQFDADCLAFLDSVVLLQTPKSFRHVLNIHPSVSAEARQASVPARALTKVADHTTEVESIVMMSDTYRACDFATHLQYLAESLVVLGGGRFTIDCGVFEHAIQLHYEPGSGVCRWILQDPNDMPGKIFDDTDEGRLQCAQRFFRLVGATSGMLVIETTLKCDAALRDDMRSRLWLYHRRIEQDEAYNEDIASRRKQTDSLGSSLLRLAAYGDEDACVKVIEAGVDLDVGVDKYGNTPLYLVCYFGYENIVRQLILAGADLRLGDVKTNTETPLRVARRRKFPAIARLILNAMHAMARPPQRPAPSPPLPSLFKADLSEALQQACRRGDAKAVERLIDAGAKAHRLGEDAGLPLVIACEQKHSDVVRVLLEAGADPDRARSRDRYTPLHIACQQRDAACVELLLMHGANRSIKVGAKSPASIARHHAAIAKLLKDCWPRPRARACARLG
ncbi:MAG: ankyrin repeat domain-containing protein [Coxiellaceae bacterium]|nr:ankyrin repeat domain-containing protein [Coxiellaceae bacterium]